MEVQRFKVSLIGEGGVGKTTFLSRLLEGRFEKRYFATLGAEVRTLRFSSNYGEILFDCWDTAGQEKFIGLGDGYFIGSNACVAMFDCESELTIQNLKKWIGDYIRIAGVATPIAICRTKTDLRAPNYSAQTLNKLLSNLLKNTFCEISAKNQEDCSEPFLWIAREITGKADLVFI